MRRSVSMMSMVVLSGTVACSEPAGLFDAQDVAVQLWQTPEASFGLRILLDDWVGAFGAISDAEFQRKTETEQEVYRLFEAIWNPMEMHLFSNSAASGPHHSPYRDVEYLVVHQSIGYRVNGPSATRIGIGDFRPRVSIPGKKIIYSGAVDTDLLDRFVSAGRSVREKELRLRQITSTLGVWPRWCDKCWYTSSGPTVMLVAFDPGLTKAELSFAIRSMWGRARAEKIDGVWKLTSSAILGQYD